ncbi:nuclear transport factor 2 family protein [Parahaliea sp. F7430]|uniref:Nuclear transport factor 2 family protein n=1 Tax=Sediminihaliea albiluteola TaxID=2758564 RepID=A0A7W2TV68_9GAMM|nr:nuclear transport factor 2 family protein [Sediminihaliea albiluteola]MBA6412496.1 nuclear transport factor 2 family protein [Sediminihaliea albiluteola]
MKEIESLQQQLTEIQDKAAITQLKYRYFNACDAKQPEEVLSCFAAGEVDINFGHIGQFSSAEDFVAIFVELGCHEHIVDIHHAQNPIIELQGPDRATGYIGLHFHSLNTQNKSSTQLAGHYSDEYRKIDGQWRITRSHFNVSWVELRDFSGDVDVVTYAGNKMPG